MPIDSEIIDKLLKDYQSPEDVLGEHGLLKEFTKAVLERVIIFARSLLFIRAVYGFYTSMAGQPLFRGEQFTE